MKLLFFLTRQGGLRRRPFVAVVGALVLAAGAAAIALSLAWPGLSPVWAVLEAALVSFAVWALTSRIVNARRLAAAPDPLTAPTGLIDDVTRTLNRRGITSSLIEAMAQSQRYGTPLSLISLGIDGARGLVERLGSEVKAPVLEATSAALGEVLRLPGRYGRYQGWEFLVVLPHTRAKQAALVVDRLRAALAAAPPVVKGETLALTVSAGIAEFASGQDPERFLSNAHKALHKASKAGGDQARIYRPAPPAKTAS